MSDFIIDISLNECYYNYRNRKQANERKYKMTLYIKKTANIISVISDEGIVFKTWFADDFTERKLSNTVKKISKELNGDANFIRMF